MKRGIQQMTVGLLLSMGMALGCEELALHAPTQDEANKTNSATYIQKEAITGDTQTRGRGAVDAAMEWADKYAQVAQELLYANKRIGEMEQEKKTLQGRIAKLTSELTNYQTELNDANAMLNDMKNDLKAWRANVLGFRKDITASQNAILQSQQRILELLGGEVSRGDLVEPAVPTGAPASNGQQSRNETSSQASKLARN